MRDEGRGPGAEGQGPRAEGRGEQAVAWPRLYAAVLGTLVVEIILFYLLTRAFH